ncbi:MAG: hypothetical protein HQL51_14185 [Magnetococcales bacterium]|nr:hypothetical protein [Magnetococcales bacterium]
MEQKTFHPVENPVAFGDDWARCANAKSALASLESAPEKQNQNQDLGGTGNCPPNTPLHLFLLVNALFIFNG